MSGHTWLSIDFDFFVWNGMECNGRIKTVHPKTGEIEETSALPFFDWGHDEGHPAAILEVLWYNRFESFRRAGVSPYKTLIDVPGVTNVEDFSDEIHQRFSLDHAVHYIADSHMHGYQAAITAYEDMINTPATVIHFDAHCDMGYSAPKIFDQQSKGICDCGSWLWHAADQRLVEEIVIVYPDWKGTDEWDQVKDEAHIDMIDCSIKQYTYSDWLRTTAKDSMLDIKVVYSCRSSSWTPPWLDDEYEKLKTYFCASATYCLDCENASTRYDACTPRAWEDPTEPPQSFEAMLKIAQGLNPDD